MRIEYRSNGMQREVRDSVGDALISRNLATRVYQAKVLVADKPEQVSDEGPAEISERTGKPKRRYKRRDMTAEG